MGKKRKVAGGEDGEAVKEAAAPKVLLKRELFKSCKLPKYLLSGQACRFLV